MTFQRQPSGRWHAEVPGARWFRADLHVHTVDDHPGGRAKVPAALSGMNPAAPDFLSKYARVFLQAAVAANVQIVALTPHAVKCGVGPETSAVWAIVDCWNNDSDDDGTPFREKVYAVFPGFEPCFNVGSEGLHLLFLFDPEIGRERYLEAFTLVMGGKAPWSGNQLAMSSLHAHDAFERIGEQQRANGATWDYIVLAPHIDSKKGLFKTQKSQVLQLFEHHALAALEMSDNKLPSEIIEDKGAWFEDGLHKYRHTLYHASDAYKIAAGDDPAEFELGHRVTWLKLAQPRIEALRQAFLAADSRVAIAYERDADKKLVERTDAPTPVPTERPWLRGVSVEGGASFFGGIDGGEPIRTHIPFNPGLTCLIGGSMTGKSTLLDGLRLHVGSELPADNDLRTVVQRRGEGLLRGGPSIELETPARPMGERLERWPAVFYTQNELQSLMRADGATGLVRGLTGAQRTLVDRLEGELAQQDDELGRLAERIRVLSDERDQAAQKATEADDASKALKAFEDAGMQELQSVTRLASILGGARANAQATLKRISDLRQQVDSSVLRPEVEAEIAGLLGDTGTSESVAVLHGKVVDAVNGLGDAAEAWQSALRGRADGLRNAENAIRLDMERKLAAAGLSAEEFANFKQLARRAELRDSYRQAFDTASARLEEARETFERRREDRAVFTEAVRQSFDSAISAVAKRFDGRIRIRRIPHARADGLESFLKGLGQKGITQWWNGLGEDKRPSPDELADAIESDTLRTLGASDTVAARFSETVGELKRYALRAIRSEDRYVFEQRLENGEYRPAEDLSGGRRVSLLLTLLLEMEDDRPLVIDQPEDELDNRVLWDTVLPALRRLKGRRQIILVTHNANIVVNGDADLVVQLEAEADRGRVAAFGAIEDPTVRHAIVETVDGGRDAFELRKIKYGF